MDSSRIEPDEVDRRLSDLMSSYWLNFARTGNPNGDGLPHWPVYSEEQGPYLEFGNDLRAGRNLGRQARDFFESSTEP